MDSAPTSATFGDMPRYTWNSRRHRIEIISPDRWLLVDVVDVSITAPFRARTLAKAAISRHTNDLARNEGIHSHFRGPSSGLLEFFREAALDDLKHDPPQQQ